jgi:hypothetical protein
VGSRRDDVPHRRDRHGGRETDLPDEPIPADFIYRDETPVVFGHYWMQGKPVLHPHASGLDFSVANDGFLTAYR